jgi:hypothetical protein
VRIRHALIPQTCQKQYRLSARPSCINRFIGTFVARSLIDIVTLDLRIEEEISKYGVLTDFHIVLWRQDPDTTGCNWNAHIKRIHGSLTDSNWWDVVPQMRERFNLS